MQKMASDISEGHYGGVDVRDKQDSDYQCDN